MDRRDRLEQLLSDDDAARRRQTEGIVSKRLGGAYWSGRCRSWLKVKNPAFVRG
jgi:ATP-dependent DNA ligase